MDETAPTTPGSDSAGMNDRALGALRDGSIMPDAAATAQSISAGAEALGMPSTLPTADTAPAPVENSQAGLPAATTQFGGPGMETTTPTTTTTEQPQSTIPMVDQIAAHATAIAKARSMTESGWRHVPAEELSRHVDKNPISPKTEQQEPKFRTI